ncbi:MAG: 5-formyltetrahydrofolate cyclo-ligase [Oscillospiraceae bacterium]|nr:5-formyltetrahydrofolate cyclo-ligase [Oscillospiraceae bacterium]
MDKETLRQEMRIKRQEMREEEIAAASDELAARLFAHPLYRAAKTLYVYLSANQEVRTEEIIRQARCDGKRVAAPRVCGSELRFFFLAEDTRLEAGSFGILEPVDAEEANDPTALVLLPGLAFDRSGYRLGYGGGFYDRFLARENAHPTVALCYGFQLLDNLPHEPHDVTAAAVLTAE